VTATSLVVQLVTHAIFSAAVPSPSLHGVTHAMQVGPAASIASPNANWCCAPVIVTSASSPAVQLALFIVVAQYVGSAVMCEPRQPAQVGLSFIQPSPASESRLASSRCPMVQFPLLAQTRAFAISPLEASRHGKHPGYAGTARSVVQLAPLVSTQAAQIG